MTKNKQQKVLKKITDIIEGKKTFKSLTKKELLLYAGYSESTANKPKQVMDSKSFNSELRNILLDSEVPKQHKKSIDAKELIDYKFPRKVKDETIYDIFSNVEGSTVVSIDVNPISKIAYVFIPDHMVRLKAIDMIYKLSGSYAPLKVEQSDPLSNLSDDELDNKLKELEERHEKHIKYLDEQNASNKQKRGNKKN